MSLQHALLLLVAEIRKSGLDAECLLLRKSTLKPGVDWSKIVAEVPCSPREGGANCRRLRHS